MSSWGRCYLLRLLALGSQLGVLDASPVHFNVSFPEQLACACMGIQLPTMAFPISSPFPQGHPLSYGHSLADPLLPYLSSSTVAWLLSSVP